MTTTLRDIHRTTNPYDISRHTLHNQPWEDTMRPTDEAREHTSPAADHHWRAPIRRRSIAVTSDVIVRGPRVPRRRVVRAWGMGEVAVLALVALAIVGAASVLHWIIER